MTYNYAKGHHLPNNTLKIAIILIICSCISARVTAAGGTPVATAAGHVQQDPAHDTLAIQEVEVNAGYYTVKDRERTGSIARVTAKDIAKQPVLNVMEALKGRMAGVEIRHNSGEIGASATVRIRGQNSIRTTPGVNDPLYLIDGVPFHALALRQWGNANFAMGSPLNSINPNDIESIEVLKDADATAIYGSRGSNGVVLITTKKGAEGRNTLTVEGSHGAGGVRKFTDVLNTAQYLQMRREAYANSGVSPSGSAAKDLLVYDTTRYTDWQQELLGGTAHQSTARISLTGGGDGLRYLMSGTYLNQTTVYPGDFGYRRGGGHLSLSQQRPGARFQAQLAITYSIDDNDMPKADAELAYSAITLVPHAPDLLTEDGKINYLNRTFTENPMADIMKPYRIRNHNSTVQAMISYRILPMLSFKTSVGYSQLRSAEKMLDPASSKSNPALTSNLYLIDNQNTTWHIEPQLDASWPLWGGQFRGLVGGTIQRVEADGTYLTGRGFTSEELMHELALAEEVRAGAPRFSQYRYLAGYARLNYNHSGRYLLNVTARRDGSSRFGPGKRWGTFGAAGAAWLFGEEPLLKRLHWLSFGKLRASYGVTGSDQIPDYGYLATYSLSMLSNYPLTASPTRLANSDYRWENTWKLESAVELRFLDDRISTTVAWYRNRSANQLVGYPLPAMTGFTDVQFNLQAKVENTGWEVELNTVNVRKMEWEWTTSLNITLPKRVLLAYPGIEASSYASIYEVGRSMDRVLKYGYLGLNRETGLYEFFDKNEDGRISSDDRVFYDMPRVMYGGIGNQVRFKALQLGFFLQIDRRGVERIDNYAPGAGYTALNQPVEVMARMQAPDDGAPHQPFSVQTGAIRTAQSQYNGADARMQDLLFVRLSNIHLAWQCPAQWYEPLGLRGLGVSLQVQNLWNSDTGNRFDPETSYRNLPPLRMATGSIQITL